MNNSNSPSNPPSSRPTLKLKTGVKRSANEVKAPSLPQPQSKVNQQSKANQKPGAHWSDEYKQRMQADMDALTSR